MKILLVVVFLANLLLSDTIKVYLYAPEINVNNFKSLKMSFDTYLGGYGEYELQPFSDKETFEKYLNKRNAVAILSSWHYREIGKKYNLEPMLVAKKSGSTTDRKVLVGKKNLSFKGIVTSAYPKEYTDNLLANITGGNAKALSVLKVPKEIDALMSVGFGMSRFALISKDTYAFLQTVNPVLSRELKVYYESGPEYRMFLACNTPGKEENKLVSIFKNMERSETGKTILNMIGIDELVMLSTYNSETGDAQ